jgi:hypothetical protein
MERAGEIAAAIRAVCDRGDGFGKADVARAAAEAVAAARAAYPFQQSGAGQGLEDRLDAAAGGAEALRHLGAAGHRAIRSSAGVEGHVQQHGDGGKGTILAQESEELWHTEYLRAIRVDIQGCHVSFG